jgi:anti-sigma B factor antagonist
MAFTLKTRKVSDVVVVDMSGELTAGEPVLLLRNTLQLVTTYTSARKREGDAKLLNLATGVKDLLQLTKLLTVFEFFDDENKAVDSFKR